MSARFIRAKKVILAIVRCSPGAVIKLLWMGLFLAHISPGHKVCKDSRGYRGTKALRGIRECLSKKHSLILTDRQGFGFKLA